MRCIATGFWVTFKRQILIDEENIMLRKLILRHEI